MRYKHLVIVSINGTSYHQFYKYCIMGKPMHKVTLAQHKLVSQQA